MDHPTRRLDPHEDQAPEHPTRRLDPTGSRRRIRRPPAPEQPGADQSADPEPGDDPVGDPAAFPCPKCGGSAVGARLLTQGGVRLQRYLGLFNWRNSKVSAWVCGTCGYTEFYADDPVHLRGD